MNEWKNVPLGTLATFQRGFDLPHRDRRTGVYPVVTSAGVTDSHDQAKVKPPGVVTGRYGTIGEIFFIDQPFWPLNTTLYVRDFHGNDPEFIYFLLQRFDFESFSGKSGVPGVNRNEVHKEYVWVPSTSSEQRRISDALSDVESMLLGLNQLIDKKRNIKQAAMQELLTGKRRLPGFEGEWESSTLRQVATIRSGIAKNSSATITNPIRVNYLRVANVQDGFLDLSDLSKIEISRNDISRYSVLPGDVLMNEGGDLDKLGRGAVWQGLQEPCVHQNHVFVVRCGPLLIPSYLNAWTSGKAAREYFLVAGKQTTNLASISKMSLGELPILLPSVQEQEVIADALIDMDQEIQILKERLTKTSALKQAMMQELLTGRIRLR